MSTRCGQEAVPAQTTPEVCKCGKPKAKRAPKAKAPAKPKARPKKAGRVRKWGRFLFTIIWRWSMIKLAIALVAGAGVWVFLSTIPFANHIALVVTLLGAFGGLTYKGLAAFAVAGAIVKIK